MQFLPESPETQVTGSRDGDGAADNDKAYKFGRKPRAEAPDPFSTRQFMRLLVLRGRIQDGLAGTDDLVAA